MKDLCKKCENRDECASLCAVALEYVLQDEKTSTRELLGLDIENFDKEMDWGTSTSEFILVYGLYFVDNMPVDEITFYVSYSRQHIHRIIKLLKESVYLEPNQSKREILEKHFIDKEPLHYLREKGGTYIYEIIDTYVRELKKRDYFKRDSFEDVTKSKD